MNTTVTFKILNKVSRTLGYQLQEIARVPLKPLGNHPRELPYIGELPYSVLDLPAELGVGLRFYPLKKETYHPFIVALKAKWEEENFEKEVFEILSKFNELFSFKTANDFLGLQKGEEVFHSDSHPYEYSYPWLQSLPSNVKKDTLNRLNIVNSRYGLVTDEALELSYASPKKVEIETVRLVKLIKSITEHGFKSQYPDPLGGYVLSDGEKWKWFVEGGQHRAAVLAALGYENIPVFIRRFIRREDVSFWPNVQSGLFSEEQALLVFDRLFSAQPPPVAKDWVDYVDENFQMKQLLKKDLISK